MFRTQNIAGCAEKWSNRSSSLETEGLNMISLIWHGWTTQANADAYESP